MIIGYYSGGLSKFCKEEFIQALTDYASSKDASDDQKEQISKIISGISNKEFYLKFLEEEPSAIDITLKAPLADNLITCLADAVEYQRRRVLLEGNLETLRSLVAAKLMDGDRKPPKKPLPRPPKIIKLKGGKK